MKRKSKLSIREEVLKEAEFIVLGVMFVVAVVLIALFICAGLLGFYAY